MRSVTAGTLLSRCMQKVFLVSVATLDFTWEELVHLKLVGVTAFLKVFLEWFNQGVRIFYEPVFTDVQAPLQTGV